MARKTLTHPRKEARQERSRATVDCLVEATARILVKEGFDKASTNRIAEAAGVSIGSLYQYFPSKEALVAAVIDRHQEDLMRIVRGALAELMAAPLEEGVRMIAAVAVKAHRSDPRLHRVLAEQIPRTGRLAHVEGFARENHRLFKGYLEHHRDELRPDLRDTDLELAAYMCVTTIEALTHTAALHRPEILADPGAQALVEEATRLVAGYLLPPRRPRRAA
ncbi:MAG TPA: TetR/AcrR family transcriptional regulator [Burkholderiales bacterium]